VPRHAVRAGLFAAYVAMVPLANWLVDRLGVVPVGFGLQAPAAVYIVGLAFTLRDLLQEWAGRLWVVVAIVVGAALSWLVASPELAVASGVAFLVSESFDFAVYTPLRERGRWLEAVALSNTVGLLVDSALFLWLAFGSLEFLGGQLLGKATMTLLAVPLLAVLRRSVLPAGMYASRDRGAEGG
jgi:queuosine precursor transporter